MMIRNEQSPNFEAELSGYLTCNQFRLACPLSRSCCCVVNTLDSNVAASPGVEFAVFIYLFSELPVLHVALS